MTRLGRSTLSLGVCAVFALGAWLGTAMADRSATAPPIVYSGQILMGGVAVPDAAHMVQLALFSSATGPTGNLCDNGVASVATTAGHFSVALNDACGNALQSAEAVYVDLTVDGTHLTTRARASAVPFAVQAERTVYRAGAEAMTDGLFVGVSASPTMGAISFGTLTGYPAARAACASALGSPTAHMCSSGELVRSRQLSVAVPAGWYASGDYSDYQTTRYVDDCAGFTSASGTDIGPVWSVAAGPGITNCTVSNAILCCD